MQYADPALIVFAIAGIAYLVMLLAVLKSRTVREKSVQVLLAVNVVASIGWTILQALLRLQELHLVRGFDTFILGRIALYFLIVIGTVLFQLTRRFQSKADPGLRWWIGGAVFLVLSVVLYENPFHLPDYFPAGNGTQLVRWLLAYGVVVAGWGFLMVSSAVLTLINDRKTTAPLHRNRNKYWLLAVALAITGEGMVALFRLVFPGNLVHLAAIITAVYALLTYNLPDLRMAGRRTASYLVITLITVAVYMGGFLLVQTAFKSAPGYNPLTAGAILALALALLFNPLLSLIQRFANRLISGSRYDPRQTLSEYSKSISNILDIEVLATVVVGLIAEALEITHGALVIVHYEVDGDSFEEVTGIGKYHLRSISGLGQEMPEGTLSSKNPVVYYLRRERQPLTQYDIDLLPRFQLMEPSERAWLSSLKMDVYVPIYTHENWIGLLALGSKTSGDRYFDEDLAFLQTLADQTAVALENAKLYDDLKSRNSENERLNKELKIANAELARLDRAKTDFINIASHELRTPLTQVIGYNDILGEMIKADQLQVEVGAQMTDSVRKAARRLEEIVETMFDVSKLDTRTLDLMRAPISLSSIVTVAIDTWSKGMEERKQSIAVRGIANLPTIVADGKRLTQVFSHLIQNAIKSTPDGGQIRVTGRVVEEEIAQAATSGALVIGMLAHGENSPYAAGVSNGSNGYGSSNGNGSVDAQPTTKTERFVEVIVSDTGIGIAQDDLERIFEKFYRVGNVLLHSTGETKFKGAGPGLGLTIARGIIEAHGGRIWAESPGHDEETCPGAKFHVLLPIKTIK